MIAEIVIAAVALALVPVVIRGVGAGWFGGPDA